MKNKKLYIVIAVCLLILGIYRQCQTAIQSITQISVQTSDQTLEANETLSIDELTKEANVLKYLKEHGKLPSFYITKKQAESLGWSSSNGNLCIVAPGKAIGGDRFFNREKKLPYHNGLVYYEADINYNCGHRNAHRIVYSNFGKIYITKDHYNTFQEQ